jgi:hypothetical protein
VRKYEKDLQRLHKLILDSQARLDDRLEGISNDIDELRRNNKKGPVVICSSQRFKEEVEELTHTLEDRGFLVYPPNFRRHLKKMIRKPEHLRLQSKSYENRVPALAYHHFQNLAVASNLGGVCFVYNGCGYIGPNTLCEMAIAHFLGMPVLAAMPHHGKIADFESTQKNVGGEVLINRVLMSQDGTFLKRPSKKNGINLEDLCDWLEERVK